MILSTRGVVLRNIKYSDTSVICKIYTEELGLRSYIVSGIRSPKSKTKASLLRPLTLLKLEVYQKEGKNLQRIKEIRMDYIYRTLPFNVVKGTIGLFIVEILNKTMKEEIGNEYLFRFIYQSLTTLDKLEKGTGLFHMWFLFALSQHLGFYPDVSGYNENLRFDLQNGYFTASGGNNLLDDDLSWIWIELSNLDTPEGLKDIKVGKNVRQALLQSIIRYYQLHIEGFGKVYSNEVLEEVFK